MKELMKAVQGFWMEEDGATAVEYGVLIALIIAVCIIVIWGLGKQVNNAFARVNDKLSTATNAP